jgi:hypothetical protein
MAIETMAIIIATIMMIAAAIGERRRGQVSAAAGR